MLLIYKVTNLTNGKVYIGQASSSLEERRKKHEYDAQRQDRKTVKFHNALLKYGFNNFKWEVIKECNSQEELDYYEEFYIQEYNTLDRDHGYNLKHGGKLGGCYSDEAKEHMGEATKKKWENPEIAEKMQYGLEKATQVWMQKAKENRIEHECPVCGKIFYTANWNSHKYCSLECANADLVDVSMENLNKANEANKQKYENNKNEKIPMVYEWVKLNKNLLKNVSWNKLTFVSDLCEYIGVKDHRTVAKLFNLKNKRDLVKKLIEISENIC